MFDCPYVKKWGKRARLESHVNDHKKWDLLLAGYETVRGKYLEEAGDESRVRDNSIKGVVAIRYNVMMKRGV